MVVDVSKLTPTVTRKATPSKSATPQAKHVQAVTGTKDPLPCFHPRESGTVTATGNIEGQRRVPQTQGPSYSPETPLFTHLGNPGLQQQERGKECPHQRTDDREEPRAMQASLCREPWRYSSVVLYFAPVTSWCLTGMSLCHLTGCTLSNKTGRRCLA